VGTAVRGAGAAVGGLLVAGPAPGLSVATLVGRWMEPEAQQLMSDSTVMSYPADIKPGVRRFR